MNQFISIINREFKLLIRSGYESFLPIIYLFIIILFFNISISYIEKDIKLELIPLMIWISCLLVCVLNLETVFKDDYDDGSLDIYIINDKSLEINILAKVFSHWLLSSLPIVIVAPIFSLILGLDYNTSFVLFISLLVGTPTLSLIGSIASALTMSIKKNKILLSIVVLPLYIPILIFGTGAVNNSFFKIDYNSELLFMGIIFFIFLLITPLACSKALKISLD